MYHAKKVGTTEKGSGYVVLQDGPASFHVSVSAGDKVMYEHFLNPSTMQEVEDGILMMEKELLEQSVELVKSSDSVE